MKKLLYLVLVLFFTAFIMKVAKAQDFTFSQFSEQSLLRNPALSGIFTGDIRAAVSHRDQWASVTVPFRTTSVDLQYKLPIGAKNDVLAIGAQMSLDAAGDIQLKRTQILPAVTFHKSLSENNNTYLSAGFMGGMVNSQFDASKLRMGDQFHAGAFDPTTVSAQTISNTGYSYWDMHAGLGFSTSIRKTNLYIAVGMAHINTPTIKSFTGDVTGAVVPRYNFNLGINASSGEKGHIMAFADVMMQNGNRQVLAGVLYGVDLIEYANSDPDILYVGSYMRMNDAVIPVVKMGFRHFSVGLSYDINISKLKTASSLKGGFELSVVYRDFLQIRSSTLDKLRCTKF